MSRARHPPAPRAQRGVPTQDRQQPPLQHPGSNKEGTTMPKMKPHSGTQKRVKITGSGKLRRQKANRRHYLEHKPSTLTRRLEGTTPVAKADRSRIKKLLGK